MFFVLEGVDGCGKTTQVRLLEERLRTEQGVEVVSVREPGGTKLGETLRGLLLEPGDEDLAPETELYLFMAARSHLVRQKIAPALARGAVVISDRFLWSSAAYQGDAASLEPEDVLRLGSLAVRGAPVTHTLWLDLDPEEAFARTDHAKGDGDDRMERRGIEFQRRVRETFRRLAAAPTHHAGKVTVIDARESIAEVHERIVAAIEPHFAAR